MKKTVALFMKILLSFGIAFILCIAAAIDCGALTGKWRGNLNVGNAGLPLIFNFDETQSGETVATMDSPQQNAKDIPLTVKFCSSDSISLECMMIGAAYSGKITEEKIEGEFRQNGYAFPLTLTPERPLSERRPQSPAPPFPYMEKDTVFFSTDGTRLAATLTMPDLKSGEQCPIVVMVTGSGPQNRDEEIFEHRPFAVLADYLARNGIASFRYDDRGVASSMGVYADATIDTFKKDAQSAFCFVKGMPTFNKVGIMGHSEGGTLAVLVAAEDDPDFIVTLAGMVIPAKQTMLEQNRHSLEQVGIDDIQKESTLSLIEKMFDTIISQYNSGEVAPIDIDLICKENSLDVPSFIIESIKRNNAARNGYFDSLISLDPTDALKKISCPVLAINGSKDMQVSADSNLEAFRQNVRDVEIKRMEGLNHLLQHAQTGEVNEYGDITETISPEVLRIISEFISGQ